MTDTDSAILLAGELARDYLISFFFDMGVSVSPSHSERYTIHLSQGGYPFASRSFLVGPTNVSAAYQQHIATQLELAHIQDAADAADAAVRIVAFQTKLAQVAMTPEEMRVPEKVNHEVRAGTARCACAAALDRGLTQVRLFVCQMPLSSIVSSTGLALDDYLRLAFSNASLSSELQVNVAQPRQLAALGTLMRNSPASTLRDVMRWTALLSFASDLSEPIAAERFRFFGTKISGTPQQPPLWKRCQTKMLSSMVKNKKQGQQQCLQLCSVKRCKLTDGGASTFMLTFSLMP